MDGTTDDTTTEASGDVVEVTRDLVSKVDVAGGAVGSDLAVLEREVAGPTECLDGDGYQGSIAWTQVLREDADVDDVLDTVQQAWDDAGLATTRTDDPEQPSVQATDGAGGRYTAELVRATMTLHHLAESACRPLPGDADGPNTLRADFAGLVDPDGEPVFQDVTRSLADQVDELRRSAG